MIMKRTVSLAIVMLLCLNGIAFAAELIADSTISTGLITVTTKGVTESDEVCDKLMITEGLYRDNYYVNSGTKEVNGTNYVSKSVSGTNLPGTQHWEAEGWHYLKDGSTIIDDTSYDSVYY